MTIFVGTWIFPAVITVIIAVMVSVAVDREIKTSSGYGAIANGLLSLLYVAAAIIVDLLVWIVYLLLHTYYG